MLLQVPEEMNKTYEKLFVNFFNNINNKITMNFSHLLTDPIGNLERIDKSLEKIYNNTLNKKDSTTSNFETQKTPFVYKAMDFVEKTYSISNNKSIKSFDNFDKNVINYMKDYNFELIHKMANDTRLGIKGSIIEGMERGESTEQIAKRVSNHINEPFKVYKRIDLLNAEKGITKLSETKPIRVVKPYTRAMSIVKTEVARAYNNGMRQKFLQNGVQKVIVPHIPGECVMCRVIANGSPYDLNAINSPPWHTHCRHWLIPYGNNLNSDMREFMTYEAVNNYQKSLSANIDYVGNWTKSQKDIINNAFNVLPSNLKNDMFITEGVIEKTYGTGYNKIDNLYYQIGSEISNESMIEILLSLYAINYYYRYNEMTEIASITEERFVNEFINYYHTQTVSNKLQDIFDMFIFSYELNKTKE